VRMRRLSGWQLLGAAIIGALVLVLLATVLLWAALVLGVAATAAFLHLGYLPRWAGRLGISTWALVGLSAPPILLAGWLIGNVEGLVVGVVLWLVAMVVPRVALWYLGRRLAGSVTEARRRGTLIQSGGGTWQPAGRSERQSALVGVTCPGCALVSFAAEERCPRCGTSLPRA
jgi:hypothetical protein